MKMNKNVLFSALLMGLGSLSAQAQSPSRPVKISHAEPLFQDLVRDLGARKGEKEFNFGTDFSSGDHYREQGILAEYEFAPINRLGLEVETDFSFFRRKKGTDASAPIPGNRLDGLRLSGQYTFVVSEKHQASLAVGYTQIFELTDFKNYGKDKLISGLVYSPFFIAAKKWGSNIHTMIYTYPEIEHRLGQSGVQVDWAINTSMMYSLPNTGHFIGVEVNKEITQGKMYVTFRPQVKVELNDHFALGFVTGIPLQHRAGSNSSFFRLIYEP